jgi:hypothetical protein
MPYQFGYKKAIQTPTSVYTIGNHASKKKYLQIPISATFFSIFSSPEPKAHMSTLGVRRLSSTINLSQFLLPFLENH